MKLKVLELFGGIGACTAALKRLGIDYEIADYVEIDKYAVASYNAMNGTTFEPQDITKWDKDIQADLVMHGSPCQDFSLAGKQAGGDEGSGTRSSLMYETIRIVEKLKPKYVIWENVKNIISKKHKHNFDNYLSKMEELGYKNHWQVLNAKDYGIPQNRERVFTVSIKENIDRDYVVPQKEQLNLKLKDMLEENVDGKYYLSDKMKDYIVSKDKKYQVNENSLVVNRDIACSKTTREGTTRADTSDYICEELPENTSLISFEFPPKEPLKLRLKDMLEEEVDPKYYLNDAQIERIKTTSFVSGGEKTRIQNSEVCGALLARDYKDPKCVQAGILKGEKWEKMQDISRRVYSGEGISPSIHTCQGGNTEPKVEQEVSNTKNDGGHYTENSIRKIQQNIRDKEDIASTITANAMQSFNHDNCQLIKVGDNEKEITKFPSIIQKCGDRGNNNYSVSDISYTIPSNPMSDRGQLLVENEIKIIPEETFVENKYEEFIKEKGYVPEMFNPYNKTEIQEFAPTQTSCCGSNTSSSTVLVKNEEKEEKNLRIRKLTPKECWRLMGFTDEEFEKAEKVNSNSQLYKQAGNSIVVNVLEKILANLLK